MHRHVRASDHVLIGLIALAGAVVGVFAFSARIEASTVRTYADAAAARAAADEAFAADTSWDAGSGRLTPSRTVPPQTFVLPIADAARRVTKKPFGIEIHPKTSPVPNDKFDGFHVGVDFETCDDEQGAPVVISAICTGPLLFKTTAKGYGGVAVQGCRIRGEEVSVIYGHMDEATVATKPGRILTAGDVVGELGDGYGEETDGARKHLHLGIRRGRTKDIRGYVGTPEDMGEFMDARKLLGITR